MADARVRTLTVAHVDDLSHQGSVATGAARQCKEWQWKERYEVDRLPRHGLRVILNLLRSGQFNRYSPTVPLEEPIMS